MNANSSSVAAMALLATLLAGFGAWQFGSVSLLQNDHGGEHEGEGDVRLDPLLADRLRAAYGGRIKEVERERVGNRTLLEIELVDADGREREIHLDPATGEEIR